MHDVMVNDLDRLKGLVRTRSGLEFPESRHRQFEHAVIKALSDLGLADASALYRHLSSQDGSVELESFIASLTIGETYFFRNEAHFQALVQRIIPDLIERRSDTRRLRLWSAGCASGEEPYSLAMVLDRMLDDVDDWNILILATDINRDSLSKAQAGVYRNWSLRHMPDGVLDRYFTVTRGSWKLADNIRDMVTFEYLNLVDDAYPSTFSNTHGMDLILCRNVLIYFNRETMRLVADKMHDALADDGWLVVGHAEPSQEIFARFMVQNFEQTTAYRKGSTAAPSSVLPNTQSEPQTPSRGGVEPRPHNGGRAQPQDAPRRTSKPPRPDDPVGAAERLLQEDREQEALKLLERALLDRPRDPVPAYLLAQLHANRLDLTAARRWAASALGRDQLFAPAYHLAALIAEEEGRQHDALAALRRCVYARPDWPLGHFSLGRCQIQAGQSRRGLLSLDTAARLLRGMPPDEAIAYGEGLVAGRLLQLTEAHMGLAPDVADGEVSDD